METGKLQLRRWAIANYRSIRRLELDGVDSLVVLMGRNNAGKTNILDALLFLQEATRGLESAWRSRGGDLVDLVHKKHAQDHLEVELEFSLAEDCRQDVVARLFGLNRRVTVEAVLASRFLTTINLKVRLGPEGLLEQLTVANFTPEASPVPVFLTQGTPARVELFAGPLDVLCQRASGGDLPCEPVLLPAPPSEPSPFRLYLGCPPGAEAHPVSRELAEWVRWPLARLQAIDPIRILTSRAAIRGESMLAPDASNLPDVLHWLHNNRPKQFRQLETELNLLVPGFGRLYTPTERSETTLGVIEDEEEELSFTMDQMSLGAKSILAVLTKVALAPAGTWLCIEEPETYLHPQAQLRLFEFLQAESRHKRIFVATHSTAIAAATPLESLYLVERDANHSTVVRRVAAPEAARVIEQLGVQPSIDLAADAVVVVEDPEAVPIYQAWAEKTRVAVAVQFLPAEGGNTLRYLANARIATSKNVHASVFLLLDQSAQSSPAGQALRARLLSHLQLPAERVVTLDVDQVQRYLLDPAAIRRVFPHLRANESELRQQLARWATEAGPKGALAHLLRHFKLSSEAATVEARIARALDQVPAPITNLFRQIETAAKAFWSI